VLMGRLADRRGVVVSSRLGATFLFLGYLAAGSSATLWQFCLAQGLLIGLLGTSASFAPLVADTSKWFARRRGLAGAVVMTGNCLAGAVWSPVLQRLIETHGWRSTYIGMGVFCIVTMLPLTWMLRRRPPDGVPAPTKTSGASVQRLSVLRPEGVSPRMLQMLL